MTLFFSYMSLGACIGALFLIVYLIYEIKRERRTQTFSVITRPAIKPELRQELQKHRQAVEELAKVVKEVTTESGDS